jgi:hypothetical protein
LSKDWNVLDKEYCCTVFIFIHDKGLFTNDFLDKHSTSLRSEERVAENVKEPPSELRDVVEGQEREANLLKERVAERNRRQSCAM